MNYVLDVFQEDIKILDKINNLLENAIINYEYQTLLESESLSDNDKKQKENGLKKIIDVAISKLKILGEKIYNAFSNMVKRIIGSKFYYIAKSDIEIGPYTMNKYPESICNKILYIVNDDKRIQEVEDDLDKYIDKEENNKITILKGNRVDVIKFLKHSKENNKYIKLIESKLSTINNNLELSKIYQKLINFLTIIGKNLSSVISNCKLFNSEDTKSEIEAYDSNGNKIKYKQNRIISKYDKDQRDYNKVHGMKNESAIPDDMTKNEYIASIMLEAAELLRDD